VLRSRPEVTTEIDPLLDRPAHSLPSQKDAGANEPHTKARPALPPCHRRACPKPKNINNINNNHHHHWVVHRFFGPLWPNSASEPSLVEATRGSVTVSQSVDQLAKPQVSQSVSPLEWHRYQLLSVGTLVKLSIVSIKQKLLH